MCDFVSWIEYNGDVLLLRDKDIRSSRGKRLHNRIKDDIRGHGAIREYFDLAPGVGVEEEVNEFDTADGINPVVVEAIKNGEVKLTADVDELSVALNPTAMAEYNKACKSARAEHNKMRDPALAEYNKVRDAAWAEYNKACNSARAEYRKVSDQALAEYRKVSAKEFWRLWANPENRIECWR